MLIGHKLYYCGCTYRMEDNFAFGTAPWKEFVPWLFAGNNALHGRRCKSHVKFHNNADRISDSLKSCTIAIPRVSCTLLALCILCCWVFLSRLRSLSCTVIIWIRLLWDWAFLSLWLDLCFSIIFWMRRRCKSAFLVFTRALCLVLIFSEQFSVHYSLRDRCGSERSCLRNTSWATFSSWFSFHLGGICWHWCLRWRSSWLR